VKLLFDENLSPRLAERLADLYPDSAHVREVGLESAPDAAVWSYARENTFTIVTQDADFGEMSVLLDSPPKVIWLRRGNCSTGEMETILRARYNAVAEFHDDPTEAVLALL
jgi:predicted nuclease of predicted toxin-antitoxin system